MCCETRTSHGSDACCAHAEHSGCCSSHNGPVRLFATKKERLEQLEAYRDELSKELEGVNEHISELSQG